MAKPALQDVTTQLPVEHDSVAWAKLQAVLHAPQSVNVRMLVSQPSTGSLSQLRHSLIGLHTGWHVLDEHEVVPCGLVH